MKTETTTSLKSETQPNSTNVYYILKKKSLLTKSGHIQLIIMIDTQ